MNRSLDNADDAFDPTIADLRAEADTEEARALAVSVTKVFVLALAAKSVPVVGQLADALMTTQAKLRTNRLERTLVSLQDELSEVSDRIDSLTSSTRVDRESFDLLCERWTESAQQPRGDEHRHRLVRFMKNCIVAGLLPHQADERMSFVDALDQCSEFEIKILAASFGRQLADRVEALKPAFAGVDDHELIAGVERLRVRGYVVQSPRGTSWNNPLIHPIALTPLGFRFCEFVLAGD